MPLVIGQAGEGVGASRPGKAGDGRRRRPCRAVVGDRPGGRDGQADIDRPAQVDRPIAGCTAQHQLRLELVRPEVGCGALVSQADPLVQGPREDPVDRDQVGFIVDARDARPLSIGELNLVPLHVGDPPPIDEVPGVFHLELRPGTGGAGDPGGVGARVDAGAAGLQVQVGQMSGCWDRSPTGLTNCGSTLF